MASDGCDSDRRRDADKDQQWRHQEAAADAEHAGYETYRRAHRQDEEHVDRKIGDREIKLHARSFSQLTAGRPAPFRSMDLRLRRGLQAAPPA